MIFVLGVPAGNEYTEINKYKDTAINRVGSLSGIARAVTCRAAPAKFLFSLQFLKKIYCLIFIYFVFFSGHLVIVIKDFSGFLHMLMKWIRHCLISMSVF